jgi:hypothetical protein
MKSMVCDRISDSEYAASRSQVSVTLKLYSHANTLPDPLPPSLYYLSPPTTLCPHRPFLDIQSLLTNRPDPDHNIEKVQKVLSRVR